MAEAPLQVFGLQGQGDAIFWGLSSIELTMHFTLSRLASMGHQRQLSIQTLKVLRPFLADPRKELSGAEIIRASGLASGTAYPIMLRLERTGMLTSEWEKGDPKKLGRPLRRYYKSRRRSTRSTTGGRGTGWRA
jgi:PadR family transcriptional regulator PadR